MPSRKPARNGDGVITEHVGEQACQSRHLTTCDLVLGTPTHAYHARGI